MRAPRLGTPVTMALLLAAPLASCTKNGPGTNVKVASDGEPVGLEIGGGNEEGDTTPVERGPIEKIAVSASITGIGDMLDAGTKLFGMWVPPEPGSPTLNLRTETAGMLLDSGFGPGFFESLDLDAVHALDAGVPHDGQPGVGDADVDIAVVLSTTNGQRALDSLPAGLNPQPVGDDLWQVVSEGVTLLFRPRPDALEIAATRVEALDVAGGLRAKVKTGPDEPRVKIRASNLPPVDIDLSEIIPLPDALARPLSSILNELETTELAADFGTDRAAMIRVSADGPFSRLGLDPIGPPATAPSELAKALPSDALGVWLMPWGNPKLLHDVLDKQIPVDQIPAPFDTYVGDLIGGSHQLLDVISDEVLAAAYVDKGKVSIVLAASVRDEGEARKASRVLFDAATKAFTDHIALAGSSPDHKYTVSFKRDAIKVGSSRGDLFKLTIPKDMHDEFDELAWFVDRKNPRLEVSSVVVNGKLIIAIGLGHKQTMTKISRGLGRGDGLESGGGLALARKLSEGCQYCMTLDPVEIGELFFTVLSLDPDEPKQVRDAAKKALSTLAKLGLDGELALGLQLSANRGVFGAGVPKELLFAAPDKIKKVVELVESIDEAEEAAWKAQDSSSSPR